MDKTRYFVNFVISLLESCGLFALKHQAGSRARQHCDDSGRTYVVAATRSLEKCDCFLFLATFLSWCHPSSNNFELFSAQSSSSALYLMSLNVFFRPCSCGPDVCYTLPPWLATPQPQLVVDQSRVLATQQNRQTSLPQSHRPADGRPLMPAAARMMTMTLRPCAEYFGIKQLWSC